MAKKRNSKSNQTLNKSAETLSHNASDSLPNSSLQYAKISQSWEGPIPPPYILEQYEKLAPGATAQVLQGADEVRKHRHHIESLIVPEILKQEKRGQVFGLIIGICGLLVTSFAIYKEQQWAAAVLGGGTLVGLVSSFLYKMNNSDRK